MMWVYHKLGIMIDRILCTRGIFSKEKQKSKGENGFSREYNDKKAIL